MLGSRKGGINYGYQRYASSVTHALTYRDESVDTNSNTANRGSTLDHDWIVGTQLNEIMWYQLWIFSCTRVCRWQNNAPLSFRHFSSQYIYDKWMIFPKLWRLVFKKLELFSCFRVTFGDFVTNNIVNINWYALIQDWWAPMTILGRKLAKLDNYNPIRIEYAIGSV